MRQAQARPTCGDAGQDSVDVQLRAGGDAHRGEPDDALLTNLLLDDAGRGHDAARRGGGGGGGGDALRWEAGRVGGAGARRRSAAQRDTQRTYPDRPRRRAPTHPPVAEHGKGVDVGSGLGLGAQRAHQLHGRGVKGVGHEVVWRRRGGGGRGGGGWPARAAASAAVAGRRATWAGHSDGGTQTPMQRFGPLQYPAP